MPALSKACHKRQECKDAYYVRGLVALFMIERTPLPRPGGYIAPCPPLATMR